MNKFAMSAVAIGVAVVAGAAAGDVRAGQPVARQQPLVLSDAQLNSVTAAQEHDVRHSGVVIQDSSVRISTEVSADTTVGEGAGSVAEQNGAVVRVRNGIFAGDFRAGDEVELSAGTAHAASAGTRLRVDVRNGIFASTDGAGHP